MTEEKNSSQIKIAINENTFAIIKSITAVFDLVDETDMPICKDGVNQSTDSVVTLNRFDDSGVPIEALKQSILMCLQ